MEQEEQESRREVFLTALKGKKVPILTLDNQWYRLFEIQHGNETVTELEKQLNELLKRQGKLNTDSKTLRRQKKRLMGEIVPMVTELEQNTAAAAQRQLEEKLEEHKRLIEECNERLAEYQNELLDLPARIHAINFSLMLATMDYCYQAMQDNTKEILEIARWVGTIREELKKNLIHKQEMERRNHNIYSYMHDLFGAEVIDLFDMRYHPEEQHPKKAEAP
ncbi:MAG: hypothetical protein LBQ15_13565 [Clostridium sp.]|jgi:chromosome segregation ATPase|nr:hypothetical protein [Clostridium sp.]